MKKRANRYLFSANSLIWYTRTHTSNKIINIYILCIRKCEWQSNKCCNPKAHNRSAKCPGDFLEITSGCLLMLSSLLFDSGQMRSTDEIFPQPFGVPRYPSLRELKDKVFMSIWKEGKRTAGREGHCAKPPNRMQKRWATAGAGSWQQKHGQIEYSTNSIYLKAKKAIELKGHIFSTAQGISHESPIKNNGTFYCNFQYILWKFSAYIFKPRLKNQLPGKNIPHSSFLCSQAH